MTALQMLNGLKSSHDHILWLNADRREAAYHGNDGSMCTPVDFNDACLVRSDPAIYVVEQRDGEVLCGSPTA